ncbi:MAG: hypothetical protein FJ125_12155 [Deltaproteobacteria bacterium]|nr:hypothetical protein [Deltaproteobacteria bacterium]
MPPDLFGRSACPDREVLALDNCYSVFKDRGAAGGLFCRCLPKKPQHSLRIGAIRVKPIRACSSPPPNSNGQRKHPAEVLLRRKEGRKIEALTDAVNAFFMPVRRAAPSSSDPSLDAARRQPAPLLIMLIMASVDSLPGAV